MARGLGQAFVPHLAGAAWRPWARMAHGKQYRGNRPSTIITKTPSRDNDRPLAGGGWGGMQAFPRIERRESAKLCAKIALRAVRSPQVPPHPGRSRRSATGHRRCAPSPFERALRSSTTGPGSAALALERVAPILQGALEKKNRGSRIGALAGPTSRPSCAPSRQFAWAGQSTHAAPAPGGEVLVGVPFPVPAALRRMGLLR